MNPEAQKELDRILAKEPRTLTEEEKAFLRARREYVGKTSRSKFADVFKEVPPEPEAPVKDPETIVDVASIDPPTTVIDEDYEILLQKAKDLGYPVDEKATKEELKMLIDSK